MSKNAQPVLLRARHEAPASPEVARPDPDPPDPRSTPPLPGGRETCGVPFRGIVLGLLLSAVLYRMIWLVLF